MPPTRTKTSSTTDKNVNFALDAISKGMSQREASKKYGIARSTLYDKIHGKYRPGKGKGRDPFLSEVEEQSLVR